MHERRDTLISVAVGVGLLWIVAAWIAAPAVGFTLPGGADFHRYGSVALTLASFAAWVYYLKIRDRLEDRLFRMTGGHAFERDGLCFWPLIRVRSRGDGRPGQAEMALYYQNRYAGPCEAVIHLRPEHGAFSSHRGGQEVHMTFRAGAGAYGVIHQPIGIRPEHQGEPVRVQIAAVVRWPLARGSQLRSRTGRPVGTFHVDWALAHRRSRHELCNEIELHEPAEITLNLPESVSPEADHVEASNETFEELDEKARTRLA